MDRKSRAAMFILGSAIALGIASDLLLKGVSWGINVPIWMTLVLFAVHSAVRSREKRGLLAHWDLALGMMLFAALFAWRDSVTLKALDGIALFTLFALLAARIRFEWTPWQSFSEYVSRITRVLYAAVTGAELAVRGDLDWSRFRSETAMTAGRALGRGLLITIPVAALFTVLLASADSRFERLVTGWQGIDLSNGLGHLAVIGLCAWAFAGVLRELTQADSVSLKPLSYPFALGALEIGILLGTVNVLFAAFVWLQLPYLFGGIQSIAADSTVSEYARRGFFELVWVSALVLPLLLHSHAMLRNAGRGGEQVYRFLAAVMIGLLFAIMASAIHRMRLYQEQFGLTELRFYTTAFICWLALVFGWFAVTVLFGIRQRFAFGTVLLGLAAIPILHAANPDSVIARINLARAAEGKPFDAAYCGSLSADSIPVIVNAFDGLPAGDRRIVYSRLERNFGGWKWNWLEASYSRLQAWDLLAHFFAATADSGRADKARSGEPTVLPQPMIDHVPYTRGGAEILRVPYYSGPRESPRP